MNNLIDELKMNKAVERIESTDDAWEDGTLGNSIEHIVPVSREMDRAVDECLGLQAISIRMSKQLIDAYKLIAAHHGIGYQPLMRDILQRAVPDLMKDVMQAHADKAAEADHRIEELRKAE